MSLMLINPRRRKSHGKKRRSAAQRAATARMVAARRSSNPRRRTRRHATARRHNPIGLSRVHHVRRRHHRRHNPIGLRAGHIGELVMNGLKGAAGSVLVNAVTNYLPAAVKTGKVLYVSRAAIAILIGTVGQKVAGRHARAMAEGALAVNFADFFNSIGGKMLPGSNLHGVGMYMPVTGMGEYMSALPTPQVGADVGSFDNPVLTEGYAYNAR